MWLESKMIMGEELNVANFNYGISTDWMTRFLSEYDKTWIIDILKHYCNGVDIPYNSMLGRLDALTLYAMVRHFQPDSILEIGGGISTNIMFKALETNQKRVRMANFAMELQAGLKPVPGNVVFRHVPGDLLSNFILYPLDEIANLSMVFIDGAHESFFATYYCYEILDKIPKGCIVQIHDMQPPDVVTDGCRSGKIKLGNNSHPAICDEEYTALYYLRHNKFRLIASTSDLVEKSTDLLSFIPGVSESMCKRPQIEAPASSIWLEKV